MLNTAFFVDPRQNITPKDQYSHNCHHFPVNIDELCEISEK